MYKPTATYRIQFHKEFTFKDLAKYAPYLADLGIGTLYASPIFAAVTGSTHGYDGINPLQINPEIGTEAELFALIEKLRAHNIGWLQDIVPNHMAFSSQNAWLMDVLKHWDKSPYFSFFDLNLPTSNPDQRLMVPFLGETLEAAIADGKLKLQWQQDQYYLNYGSELWPTNEATKKILTSKKLTSKKLTSKELEKINSDHGLLVQLADVQYYRLCYWQETAHQINYRRFFTVNGLICLNMQRKEVFDAYHQYILELVQKGVFQGLRIDHIDGLANPKAYLEWLRAAVGDETYVVVEKILAENEKLPADWPVQGNTGYDFLAMANNLFTNRAAEKTFTKLYQKVIDKPLEPAALLLQKKQQILLGHMAGELDHLVALFLSLGLGTKNVSVQSLKAAIADLLVACPVYRFYGNELPLHKSQWREMNELLAQIPVNKLNKDGLKLLKGAWNNLGRGNRDPQVFTFYQRCMQFTGPLMAKGVEDTLMYTYNRLVAHAEVGDAADAFGIGVPKFHQLMKERLMESPYSLNATETHDAKRGEDVRARLNVLTDVPKEWQKLIRQLQQLSSSGQLKNLKLHKNDSYLIFQTLLGALPMGEEGGHEIADRMRQYLEKALREAKKRTDWSKPNEPYENAAKKFVNMLLDKDGEGYHLFRNFLKTIEAYSMLNALSQLLLKFTCPGIPDVYQGTELWDLSLVDPDNRRPVDFALRAKWLKGLSKNLTLEELWRERHNGKIKLWLLQRLLQLRQSHSTAFNTGAYVPVDVMGTYKKNLIAFLRKGKNEDFLVVVPLGLASIAEHWNFDQQTFDWKDTALVLPNHTFLGYENLLTKEKGNIDVLDTVLPVNQVLKTFPIAVLHFKSNPNQRASGILLPLFSLPSTGPIGQLGASAHQFVNFLASAKQRYWQLLPLNPVGALQSYSPYSSHSSMAGNTLFIDLVQLHQKGWLSKRDLKPLNVSSPQVNYKHAEYVQEISLRNAYQAYLKNAQEFEATVALFCEQEKDWLDDFALYSVLRNHHQKLPWNEWPERYKFRETAAISKFAREFEGEIKEVKWQQCIFNWQWGQLREECAQKDIQLIGDLPFYVSYDSADVWTNPKLFKLSSQLDMEVTAGVPPDLFNADGQLWGLPIFDWEYLKSTRYEWWLKRIQKNLKRFDLLRLDHFRAFHTYFEIEANAKSAKGGVWVPGPRESFLNQVVAAFPSMPFIVEDLGGDMEETYVLRDQFKLPGMKVLQFAFDEHLAYSPDAPHNFYTSNTVLYAGTHDNNTIRGWYDNDLNTKGRERLEQYLGKKIKPGLIHHELIRVALSSNAKLAILQAQDLLGLGAQARINTPATVTGNWLWRMEEGKLTDQLADWLAKQVLLYGRW